MNWSLTLLLFAGIPVQQQNDNTGEYFQNYHRAHRIARKTQKPLLMILGNDLQSPDNPVALSNVRKTAERRKLLKDYVVVVIDAKTAHGKAVSEAYAPPKLPHVVVLDKRQEYVIFTTSDKLYGQRWSEILRQYREGKRAPRRLAQYCST